MTCQVHELLPGRASVVHQKYLTMMEKECGFASGKVPQLEDVSNCLKSEATFVRRHSLTPRHHQGTPASP